MTMPKIDLYAYSPAEAELLCRMVEAATGEPRPEGMPATDAVQRMLDAETRGFFTRVLCAVMHYISEVGDLEPQSRSAVLH
jgi:hypothetical protein